MGAKGETTFPTAIPAISGHGTQHSIGDNLGGKLTFSGAIPSGRSARLDGVIITESDDIKAGMTLVLFNANPTASTFTDNEAMVIHESDRAKMVHKISITASDFKDFGGNGMAVIPGSVCGMGIVVPANSTLYGALYVDEAQDRGSATALTVSLVLLQD